jgi:putative ABC transport system permease protein
MYYVVDELSYDKFNVKADRIYRINTDIKYGGSNSAYAITQPPLAEALRENFPEVEKATRLILATDIRFKKGAEIFHESKTAYADASIFGVFTLNMLSGDPNTALKEPNAIVVTERAAKKYFNKTNVVGDYLTLVNTSTAYKITGVLKDMPAQSHFNFDYFMSMPSLESSRSTNWNNFSFTTYVLLRSQANVSRFEVKLNDLVKTHFGEDNYKKFAQAGNFIKLSVIPVTDIHLRSNRQYELGTNNSIIYIYIFSAIALFVLLIACINFMNLSTARSANRAKEVGVRKVLGSSRNSLIVQFISESLLVTSTATLIAFFASLLLIPLFNQMSGKDLSISSQMLGWLLPSLFFIALFVGILAGSYPAFYLSGFQPIRVLKGKLSVGFKGGYLRSVLVVVQFSISIFLIIGTLVVYNQLSFIRHKDLGYNRNQVLVIKNSNILDNAKVLKQAIKQIPAVENASLSGFLPTGSLRAPDAVFKDKEPNQKNALFTEIWPVDEDYLNTMGMRVIKGRNFSKDISTDSLGVIINATAAKMLGYFNQPLDKKLYVVEAAGKPTKELHVIGVLKDFNFSSLRDNITPIVMRMAEDKGALSIRLKAQNLKATINAIERQWNSFSPNQRFEYSFMDQDFDAAYRYEQRTGSIFLAFTLLALIIASLGLFGLAAFAAEQRNKEIGIRKILGANVWSVVTLLSKDFIKLVMIAIAIATPLAWIAMQKWLQSFAYRQNIQWWVLLVTAFGAIGIAFITVSFQSVKAAVANPVDSLRSE